MPGNTAITIYGGESSVQFDDGLVRFVDEAQRLAKFNGMLGNVDIYDSFAENNTGCPTGAVQLLLDESTSLNGLLLVKSRTLFGVMSIVL